MAEESSALNSEQQIVERLAQTRQAAGLLEAEPPAETPNDAAQAPEPAVEGADTVPDAPEPDAEPAVAPEAPEGEPDLAPSVESETPAISNLNELAEHLGVDVSELYNIAIPMNTPDGQRVEVSLGEWKDGYRARQDAERERAAAEAVKAQFEAQLAQSNARVNDYAQQMAAYLTQAESVLAADENAINWAELREADPAEYTAKRLEMQERRQKLQSVRDEAANKLREEQAAIQQQYQTQAQERLESENRALLNALPAWQDSTTRAAEQAATVQYLTGLGFAENDIANIIDHRLVVVADKARRFDALSAETEKLKAQAPKTSKVLKPGARRSAPRETAEQKAVRDADAAYKKSGRTDDLAVLLAAQRAARMAEQTKR